VSRNSSHSHVRRGTIFSLSRLQDSFCANCTPYSVTSVRLTPQLRRDLQWWIQVPNHANSKNIHRPVEPAYIHCDSSGYGWGAVLNGRLEARGFWGP
jgi:hypothetical protein